MKTLRGRFILTHILPTLLVVPLASLIILYLVETQVLLTQLAADVESQALLLAELLEEDSAVWQDNERARFFVVRVRTAVTGDITLQTPDGAILASTNPSAGSGQAPQSPQSQIGNLPISQSQSDTRTTYTLFIQSAEAAVPVYDVQNQLAGYVRVTSTLDTANQVFTELRRLIILVVVVELIIGVVIGAYLAARMAWPITAASTAVTDIAHHNRTEPIPESGTVELKALTHAVNVLATRLRELEDNRRHLLANLVHELGRPLGAMLAAVSALRSGADEDPALRAELLKGVEEHIHVMRPLLDDLAQLGGQVLGTRELNRQPVALSDWLPPLLLPWRAAAQEKGLRWQTDISPHLPTLEIDPDRLAQAIGNLLSNAIKYTPKEGQVMVTAASTSDLELPDSRSPLSTGVTQRQTVLITIADTGPGIPPDEQSRIFEPFYRSRAQTRFPQGMGLGLTIARDLVEAHGGQLTLESEVGQGSKFVIELAVSN
ncbi:MAG: HAMP domain-containing histidine kinase [Anaerolineae bacterium]|nr:HAMP domain-containing histidine kinase [Anaerolineae bacterium]